MLEILTGTGAARHQEALKRYATHLGQGLATGQLGTGLWLTPSARTHSGTYRALRELLKGRIAAPNLHTFESFSEIILSHGSAAATPITPSTQFLLLSHAIQTVYQRGECQEFSAVIETRGFTKIVSDWIAELKRDETWPEEFLKSCQQQKGGATSKDLALAAIYHEYQALLNARGWYDQEGRSWLARAAVSQGARAPFDQVRLVVCDGFVDFTWIQYELLEQFARWNADIVITLPDEFASQRKTSFDRSELFAIPRRTLEILRARIQPLHEIRVHTISTDPDQGAVPAGLEQLSRSLFGNPRIVSRSSTAAGFDAIAAGGPHRELEAVSYQIKKWRSSGFSAEDILVVVRGLASEASRWLDHFELAGIPVYAPQASSLETCPVVRWIAQLVKLELNDWTSHDLRLVVSSTFFRPAQFPPKAKRALLAWLAKSPASSRKILSLKARERAADPSALTTEKEINHTLVSQGLEILLRMTEKLSTSHSFEGWIDLWAAIISQWTPFLPDSSNDRADRADWELLQRILRRVSRCRGTWQDPSERISLQAWWSEVEACLSVERSLPPAPSPGMILLIDPAQARFLDSARCVVIVGATEQAYPAADHTNCLYSHAERQSLISAGLRLVREEDHSSEETLLFWQLVSMATENLLITYPAINAKGQELFPSPFVLAACDLFTKDVQLPRHVGSIHVMPEREEIHTRRDLRILAFDQAMTGHAGWWKTGLLDTTEGRTYRNMARGLPMLQARYRTEGFTEYEGMLNEPALRQEFARQYGPEHQFSVTRLELYANCPFRFWIEEVLGLSPRETRQLSTNHLMRGTALHSALASLLGSGRLAMADEAELSRIFAEHVAVEMQRRAKGSPLAEAMARLDSQIVSAWSEQFAASQREYLETMVSAWGGMPETTLPEVAFGQVYDDHGELILGPYPALEISRDEHLVRLGGKIDRIDAHQLPTGEQFFSIIDYKSGGASQYRFDEKAVQQGLSLQLVVYLLAVKRLRMAGENAEAWQAGFWGLRKEGLVAGLKAGRKSKEWNRLDESSIHRLEEAVQQSVIDLAISIRNGEFMVDGATKLKPSPCSSQCPTATVCRVKQQVGLAKQLHKIRPALDAPRATSPVENPAS